MWFYFVIRDKDGFIETKGVQQADSVDGAYFEIVERWRRKKAIPTEAQEYEKVFQQLRGARIGQLEKGKELPHNQEVQIRALAKLKISKLKTLKEPEQFKIYKLTTELSL